MGKTFQFGRDARLVGVIRAQASAEKRDIGLIVWGLGLAEFRIVKRLSSTGLTAMQFDRQNQDGGSMRANGVELCREAIDELARRHELERFVLVGTCATGSICLNTALVDARVVGLILVNLHISEKLSYWPTIRSRCMSWTSWRRVFTGHASVSPHFKKMFFVARSLVSNRMAEGERSVLIATYGDTAAPEDLATALSKLAARGVETLLVSSEDDYSLHYFRKVYGKDLSGLGTYLNLSVNVLSNSPHFVSDDAAASRTLEDMAFEWMTRTSLMQSPRAAYSPEHILS